MFTLQIEPVLQYPIYLLQSPPVGVDKIRTSNITLHHRNQSHIYLMGGGGAGRR